MKPYNFIIELKSMTQAEKAGIFGSFVDEKNPKPNDIDIFLAGCKRHPTEELLKAGIDAGILKTVSVGGYNTGPRLNSNGLLDVTFFFDDASFGRFLAHDNKHYITF